MVLEKRADNIIYYKVRERKEVKKMPSDAFAERVHYVAFSLHMILYIYIFIPRYT